MLYLVRHGKAGSRSDFHGDDRMRPLSLAGYRQAQALADSLAAAGVKMLISSPFLRCIETLQPTARAIGTTVTDRQPLGGGSQRCRRVGVACGDRRCRGRVQPRRRHPGNDRGSATAWLRAHLGARLAQRQRLGARARWRWRDRHGARVAAARRQVDLAAATKRTASRKIPTPT